METSILIKDPKKFILAGNSFFTIKNVNTNNHLTYKVKKSKTNEFLFFVSV